MTRIAVIIVLGFVALALPLPAQENPPDLTTRIEQAVKRTVPLLEKTTAETAQRRTCFTCHGQAMPIVALVEVRRRGMEVDPVTLDQQLSHTYAHLERSKEKYADGSGTGGQVDTAGWALWALEAGDREADEVTDAVISYLLTKQKESGVWKCSSNRPPSEASSFATTYLALRGLDWFGNDSRADQIEAAKENTLKWFRDAKPKETEDRVFQLLSLPYLGLEDRADDLVAQLGKEQRNDGGWAQLAELDSDVYATATALYALSQTGMNADDPVYRRGVEYLLDHQNEDGSWFVKTRSKPFQTYFESGFPHGKDQFISTTATCWAIVALLHALPATRPAQARP